MLILAAYYLAISLLAYAVYALDKRAAIKQQQRISERSLHLLSLLGGWPGAFLAQRRLRHKTQKTSFLMMFWFTVLLNLAGLALLSQQDTGWLSARLSLLG